MRGLTIVVVSPDADRLRAALTIACAAAALGGETRVYLHEEAVALLANGGTMPPPGLPTISELRTVAIDTGVTLIACQTGLALAGLSAETERVAAGGMIDLLATLDDDRLVTI